MTLHEDELSRQLRNKEQHLQTVERMLLESDERVKELEKVLNQIGCLTRYKLGDSSES